jgi:hypothetical protein
MRAVLAPPFADRLVSALGQVLEVTPDLFFSAAEFPQALLDFLDVRRCSRSPAYCGGNLPPSSAFALILAANEPCVPGAGEEMQGQALRPATTARRTRSTRQRASSPSRLAYAVPGTFQGSPASAMRRDRPREAGSAVLHGQPASS